MKFAFENSAINEGKTRQLFLMERIMIYQLIKTNGIEINRIRNLVFQEVSSLKLPSCLL